MGFNVICAAFKEKFPKTVCHTIFINDKFLVIKFPFMPKKFVKRFHLWENVNHRVFIQFSVPMELYGIV